MSRIQTRKIQAAMTNKQTGNGPYGWVVNRGADGDLQSGVSPLPGGHPEEFVCIDVEAAGFNYKDALTLRCSVYVFLLWISSSNVYYF